MKKILSVILTAVMLLSISPITAFAGGDEIELSLDTPYEVWVDKNAEVYRFTPSDDGWYRFYTSGDFDTYATLYNSNWDQITFADDYLSDTDFDFSCKLYAGYTYYLEVGAYVEDWQLAKFNLYACETVGVEEAVITKEPDDKTCIIGLENESVDLTGMEVTFTLSNGEEVLWSYDNSSYVAGNMVYVYTDNDGMGHYYVDVMCGDAFERLYLDMIENPVESISVYSMSAIELYENSCGYLYDGEYIYDYRIPDDAKMQINYKDGSSAVVDYQRITSDGFYFRSDDIQYYAPWSVGDNEFTIYYMGCMTTATVKILPCPYESYTLLSAPSRVYVHRDSETGYIYDGDYILQPEDLTGLSFELGYSNGTTEIIDADNIDMESMEINGYPYSIGEYMVTGAGNIPVTLSYKGMDIKYSVQIVETPVESIEVLKAPDKTEYEDRYHADYSGMKIKVNYKDGTFDTVTLNKENMEYVLNGSLYCYVPVGDNKLCVSRQFDVVSEEYYTTVSCLGCLTEYNEIKYTKSREVASIIRVENFAYNTDGMTVYVEYESGQEENLTYSMLDYYDYGDDMYEGFAMTENGVAYFDTALKSKDDYSSVYSLYTLGKYIDIEVMDIKPGDVNGDNNITVDDVTLVQLHLAKLVILQNNYLAVADTDKDGLITIMDATMIQYYISQFITEL